MGSAWDKHLKVNLLLTGEMLAREKGINWLSIRKVTTAIGTYQGAVAAHYGTWDKYLRELEAKLGLNYRSTP